LEYSGNETIFYDFRFTSVRDNSGISVFSHITLTYGENYFYSDRNLLQFRYYSYIFLIATLGQTSVDEKLAYWFVLFGRNFPFGFIVKCRMF